MMTPQRKWKKLLYVNQFYPDNYTDASFLSQLKRNSTVVKHSYWKLVQDFCLVAQHLQCILAVELVFKTIYHEQWNPAKITTASSFITLIVFIIWSNQYQLKSSFVIVGVLLILSPILKSLTRSTSSDSIWAISFCLCVANTLFHEYALSSDVADCRPIVSTNISFVNAIVLASRLQSNISVYCFVLFAIQGTILMPLFGIYIRQHYGLSAHKYVYLVTAAVVNWMILEILGLKVLILWMIVQLTVVLGLPAYFIFLQKYKNELQGPWDIANLQKN